MYLENRVNFNFTIDWNFCQFLKMKCTVIDFAILHQRQINKSRTYILTLILDYLLSLEVQKLVIKIMCCFTVMQCSVVSNV